MLDPAPELLLSAPTERSFDAPELGDDTLLAIDTALGTSVAFGYGGRIYEVSNDDSRGHAEAIGRLIARVFEVSGVSPRTITGVVAGVGPGPFTGLRVGIAAAHAFAAGRGVQVLPLQGHEAVALAMFERGAVHSIRVVQDAKRRELFVTDYDDHARAILPQRTVGPRLEARANFISDARDVWPERIPAGRLVQLAARRLVSGVPFEEGRALYLRSPDVKSAGAIKRVSA